MIPDIKPAVFIRSPLFPSGSGGLVLCAETGDILPLIAILIFTDGYANSPGETEALGIPVLWLISRDGRTDLPWGTVVKIE